MPNSIFETEEFKPLAERWQARQEHFSSLEGYYSGEAYKGFTTKYRAFGPRLYKNVRALYLPLARAVDVDAGIVPARWSFAADAPAAWTTARDVVFGWSKWQTNGVLYVHYGAVYGCAGLKVSDLRADKKLVITPLSPLCFMLEAASEYDPTPARAFYVDSRYTAGEEYEYAEVLTPDEIRTFKNGEPFGFGGRPERYPNELKFVPLVETRHINTGGEFGEATYAKALPLLDELNMHASYLSDIIQKHSDPQWAVFGAEAGELTHSGDNVWFIPSGGDAKALVPQIDIPGVLEFVREIRDQVKQSLPELSFDNLQNKDNIATATVELQLMELTVKVKRIRPNYDDGLASALRLAGQAASGMGLTTVTALDDEKLMLDPERPVLPFDKLTELRIEQLQQQIDLAGKQYP